MSDSLSFIWGLSVHLAKLQCGRPGFDPRPRHTKDIKNGRFALLSSALGINELGIRLGGSESV